ncbi:MAG: thioesterase family protein [Gammaproteobacteria bacterium]
MLDDLLKSAALQESVAIPEGWAQGRACYGGLVAALLCARLRHVVGEERVLRSATVSFVGPVAVGAARLVVEVLRSGKSVTQAEARLYQSDEVQAVLLASFGATRVSQILVAPRVATPVFRRPEDSASMPWVPGVMPEFLQQLDMRWAEGAMPFAGAAQPDFGGWMRFRHDIPDFTLTHLFGLIDAWPPAVLPMFRTPAPASSMCWTLEFLHFPEGKTGEHWWQYQVRTDASGEGYAHTEAHVWDDDGRLVAISRQTITVFA